MLRRGGGKLLSPLNVEEDSLDAEIRNMLHVGLITQKDIMTAMMHEGLLLFLVVLFACQCSDMLLNAQKKKFY
jgi:hypothetical protein